MALWRSNVVVKNTFLHCTCDDGDSDDSDSCNTLQDTRRSFSDSETNSRSARSVRSLRSSGSSGHTSQGAYQGKPKGTNSKLEMQMAQLSRDIANSPSSDTSSFSSSFAKTTVSGFGGGDNVAAGSSTARQGPEEIEGDETISKSVPSCTGSLKLSVH